jgi:rubrerythrin
MSHPTKATDVGMNRTGIAVSPLDSKETIDGAVEGTDTPETSGAGIERVRLEYSRAATPVGTMPPPASVKGAAKAAVTALKGKHAMVFLDLIGERLAFERTGVRLYDAVLVKMETGSPREGGPDREDLESIRDDELRHFAMLREAMETLGGDPTAMTPSADIAGVASMGLVQVVTDPRTTLTEALKAMLIAELTDNDSWLLLADMAERLDQEELAMSFRRALEQEEEHLARLRAWVTADLDAQAGLEPEPPQPTAVSPGG